MTSKLEFDIETYRNGHRVRIGAAVVGVQLGIPELEVGESQQVRTRDVEAGLVHEGLFHPPGRHIVRERELLQAEEAHVFLPPGAFLAVIQVVGLAEAQTGIEHIGVRRVLGRPAVGNVGQEVGDGGLVRESIDAVPPEEAVGEGVTGEEKADREMAHLQIAAETVIELRDVALADDALVVVVDDTVAIEVVVLDITNLGNLARILLAELAGVVQDFILAGEQAFGNPSLFILNDE